MSAFPDYCKTVHLPPAIKGDTWAGLTWTISSVGDGDTEFAGTLTAARFQLQTEDGTVALTRSTATEGQVTINTSTGDSWSVTVEPVALTIASGTYNYGLETTDDAGQVRTVLQGSLTIKPDPVS